VGTDPGRMNTEPGGAAPHRSQHDSQLPIDGDWRYQRRREGRKNSQANKSRLPAMQPHTPQK